MVRKRAGRHIGGEGQEKRCRGGKTSANGQHGNGCIRSEKITRLGAGRRVSWGWLRHGWSNASGSKRAASSGRIGRGPCSSGQNEPGRTHPETEFTI